MNPPSYASLPERFFARLNPAPAAKPQLLRFNHALERELGLGLGDLDAEALAAIFSGNMLPQGAESIATAYAGHQFGHFVPQLGDGRALLLAEAVDCNGRRRDIQLKGSGRTPYSRGGDGRAALGPVLREYLVSEAMHALGLPTTRALAAVATGEPVFREEALPGAVLTRVAASFIRVGTFQYFAARDDGEAVRRLADYVIDRHYPQLQAEAQTRTGQSPYLALLRAVISGQALLVARWMHVGFIHGVMNTDNMAVSGETIDYGPCAFMDAYDPAAVFSSIDRQGRYAYGNQPHAAVWNLARFAETLLPLIDANGDRAVELATEALAGFSTRFSDESLAGMRRKLGVELREEGDAALADDLLDAMHRNQADFTLTFRGLCEAAQTEEADPSVRALFANPRDYDEWAARWRARLAREPLDPRSRAVAMRQVNPVYIPRNHRIEEVIVAAVERQDFAPFARMSEALSQPYQAREGFEEYAGAPRPDQRVRQTFCGT